MIPNLWFFAETVPGPLRPGGPRNAGKARGPRWLATAATLAVLAGLWLLDRATLDLTGHLQASVHGLDPSQGSWALAGGTVAYAFILSVPFVPGMELGVALIMLFGTPGVAMAYLGTILGLSLAFAFGRHIAPAPGAGPALPGLSITLFPRPAWAPLSWLHGALGRLNRWLRRHPALLLAVLLNFPGNSLLGGGGGIGLLYGLARALPWPAYLATVALATAPVPLVYLVAGTLP